MKISYDPEVDALSITFRETTVTTKHLAEGIAADYDSEGGNSANTRSKTPVGAGGRSCPGRRSYFTGVRFCGASCSRLCIG